MTGTGLRKLTTKQAKFVDEYLIDMAAGQAAERAGYSPKNRDPIASQLLKKPQIQAALREKRQLQSARTNITADRVLLEVARRSFFDPRKLFNADGSPKDITELDDDTVAALDGIDVQEVYSGSGQDRVFVGYVKKYRLANKDNSLDKLMKHLGLYEKDNAQKSDAIQNLLEAIAGSSNGRIPLDVIDVEEVSDHPLLRDLEDEDEK